MSTSEAIMSLLIMLPFMTHFPGVHQVPIIFTQELIMEEDMVRASNHIYYTRANIDRWSRLSTAACPTLGNCCWCFRAFPLNAGCPTCAFTPEHVHPSVVFVIPTLDDDSPSAGYCSTPPSSLYWSVSADASDDAISVNSAPPHEAILPYCASTEHRILPSICSFFWGHIIIYATDAPTVHYKSCDIHMLDAQWVSHMLGPRQAPVLLPFASRRNDFGAPYFDRLPRRRLLWLIVRKWTFFEWGFCFPHHEMMLTLAKMNLTHELVRT